MNFYILKSNSNHRELFVEAIQEYDQLGLKIGSFNPDFLEVTKSQGDYIYDIVRLQDPFNFLISNRLHHRLQDESLTGWKMYKVKTKDLPDGYVGFQCIGKCGPPPRPKKAGFVEGFHFDESTWDGSDFFTPETTAMIICTEKAKSVLMEFNISNKICVLTQDERWYSA